MSVDNGGSAFGGKATAWKVIGDDEKARQIGEDLARQDDLKSLIISEEDSKRIEQLTLHLPSMSLRDWYAGMAAQAILIEALDSVRKDGGARQLVGVPPPIVSKLAFEIADAMISRKRETEKADG